RVDAAREGPGMRYEMKGNPLPRRLLRECFEFRCMPVRERLVGVQVRVPLGMMSARLERPTGTGATRNGVDEKRPGCEAGCDEWHRAQQDCRGKAARMPDVFARVIGHVGHVLRQGAGKISKQLRRLVFASVDFLVVATIGITEVGRTRSEERRVGKEGSSQW